MEGGEVLISATVVGLLRGQVGADGMARARPTAPMRQPRHQHGDGGGRMPGRERRVAAQQRKEGGHARQRTARLAPLLGRDGTRR